MWQAGAPPLNTGRPVLPTRGHVSTVYKEEVAQPRPNATPTWYPNMKKAKPLFAMASSRPCGDGARICCAMLGAAASSVSTAHTRASNGPDARDFHLTSTEVTHHQFPR